MTKKVERLRNTNFLYPYRQSFARVPLSPFLQFLSFFVFFFTIMIHNTNIWLNLEQGNKLIRKIHFFLILKISFGDWNWNLRSSSRQSCFKLSAILRIKFIVELDKIWLGSFEGFSKNPNVRNFYRVIELVWIKR